MMSGLDTVANNPTRNSKFQCESAKDYRHRLRNRAGEILGGEHRTSHCGRRRCSEVVSVHKTKTGACFRGIATCGSIWTCPECAQKISQGRAEDVENLVSSHTQANGNTFMVTLTVGHGSQDELSDLREFLVWAWDQVVRSGKGKRMRDEFGILGYVRAFELTHGVHGWHPHLHILFLTRDLTPFEQWKFKRRIYTRWKEVASSAMTSKRIKVKNAEGEITSIKEVSRTALGGKRYINVDVKALDFQLAKNPAAAGQYISKWGSGAEIAKGMQKRSKGRSIWQLLDDADHGDKQAAHLFHEYAKVFHRARHLTWARGLREHYAMGEEASDEQLAMTEEMEAHEIEEGGEVFRFDPHSWIQVVRKRLTAQVLGAAMIGPDEVENLLIRHEIDLPEFKPEAYGPISGQLVRTPDYSGYVRTPKGTGSTKVLNQSHVRREMQCLKPKDKKEEAA
ncbi:protein rep [Pseudovibrio ascidiaceicola]|uniref:protein rep n=1 Tax=Pseudovibrio ascidiaceicola TaxID=285279 RepID=UPI003D35EF01